MMPSSAAAPDSHANRLLGLLTAKDYDRLRPHLARLPLEYRKSLYQADKKIAFVYFIETGVGSLANTMTNGQAAEVGSMTSKCPAPSSTTDRAGSPRAAAAAT